MPSSAMVAQLALDQLIMVRIHGGQIFSSWTRTSKGSDIGKRQFVENSGYVKKWRGKDENRDYNFKQ